LTRSVRSSDLSNILYNRIPLQELQQTRINQLQVQRQTVLHNAAVKWLEGILDSRSAVQAAKEYLVRTGNYSNILTNRYYLYFARALWHYLNQNKATTQTNIEALYSQFVAWGYDANALKAVAALQKVYL
jgi:hypothetical protein